MDITVLNFGMNRYFKLIFILPLFFIVCAEEEESIIDLEWISYEAPEVYCNCTGQIKNDIVSVYGVSSANGYPDSEYPQCDKFYEREYIRYHKDNGFFIYSEDGQETQIDFTNEYNNIQYKKL
tara:strand:+ start:65 stop:433 length:369 start_codon:yes stop_codon:yes gene_type:complete